MRRKLQQAYMEMIFFTRAQVYGNESVGDELRSGRAYDLQKMTKTSLEFRISFDSVPSIDGQNDRKIVGINSHGVVHEILPHDLLMNKIRASVQKILSRDHKGNQQRGEVEKVSRLFGAE